MKIKINILYFKISKRLINNDGDKRLFNNYSACVKVTGIYFSFKAGHSWLSTFYIYYYYTIVYDSRDVFLDSFAHAILICYKELFIFKFYMYRLKSQQFALIHANHSSLSTAVFFWDMLNTSFYDERE